MAFECPECGSCKTGVIESRNSPNGIRRRRKCLACGLLFTTIEILANETDPLKYLNGVMPKPITRTRKTKVSSIVAKNGMREKKATPDSRNRMEAAKTVETVVRTTPKSIKSQQRNEINSLKLHLS